MADIYSLIVFIIAGLFSSASSPERQDYIETVHGISFLMKAIPAGTYLIGCGEADEPCAATDWIDKARGQRQKEVTVKAFFMAETETTWALYQKCIDSGNCLSNEQDGGDNGWGKGERPVIEVSWNDVTRSFIPWLNKETGKNYRLPTEEEWEYAARAGTTTAYSWGDKIDCSKARYGFVSNECGKQLSTDPVKSYKPNGFGLYDMHGNVWEFVQDCWDANTNSNVEETCVESVLRGGSWLNKPENLRSAARFRHERHFRESGDGFRLARSMDS